MTLQRYEGDKSFVGMALCFFCGELNGELLLNKRLRDTLPRRAVYDLTPCELCREHMEHGVILLGITDLSGDTLDKQLAEYRASCQASEARGQRRHAPFVPDVDRTGDFYVVTETCVRRVFTPAEAEQVIRCRWSFIDEQVAAMFRAAAAEPAVDPRGP